MVPTGYGGRWLGADSFLHSPDDRSRYADNLGKELPRIPAVKTIADFRAISQAGRELAHWHLEYETVACHEGVTKMKFGKTKDASGKNVNDKSTVIYNEYITLKNIPLAAYEYVVNGKPALEWVMERQSVTTDKDSGITNDANLCHRNHGQPQLPAGAVPAGGDGGAGDDEGGEWVASARGTERIGARN